ncbi:hypothetical protein D3C85_693510 [compost metagenome]
MNAYTNKAKEMNITAFTIKGVRWFQKSYGNTYHTTYISALIDGVWTDIGSTDKEYGYGEHYMCTAGQWLIENGFIENVEFGTLKDGYQFNSYEFRENNAIEHFVQDVKRQKDL